MFAGFVIDRIWWESGADKYDKNIEELEHYHWGLLAWIVAYVTPLLVSEILWGLGLALIIAEWAQIGEWEDSMCWRRGHPFAYGTEHFVSSTIIGVVLTIILIVPLILPVIIK
jgi:hypothetical protein